MKNADKFELHYYFGDASHDIDALVRNKCEAELLGIIFEAGKLLEIDVRIIKDAYEEGGFRDIWKALGSSQVMALLIILQIIISAAPVLDLENKRLEKEERKLSIEEKKLNIEKMKHELEKDGKAGNLAQAAESVGENLKVIKRRSNFYSCLQDYPKVEKIGFVVLDEDLQPVNDESTVVRSEFSRYILNTNRLKSELDESAEIEIISPVITEGPYKWKGLYKGKPIGFDMLDQIFRDAVLVENLPFQHGCKIVCVLVVSKELDEIGEIRITGYSVSTVLNKIDGPTSVETLQGKRYRHAKRMSESQTDLFQQGAAS